MSAFWAFGIMKGKGVFLLMRCTEKLRVHLFRFLTSSANRGMGKTLQTITLVWTLLSTLSTRARSSYLSFNTLAEQNPYAGLGPVVGKVMIVCPVSLINVGASDSINGML